TLELGRIREAAGGATVQRHAELTVDDRVPGRVRVRAGRQGNRGVEELTRPRDHLVATDLVVGRALLGAALLADGVGAVQRLVEGAPTSVGGVEGEPRVEDRDGRLRTWGR